MNDSIGMVAAVAVILLVSASVSSAAAGQRAPRAASAFASVVRAAEALAALEPQPADANGALRGWDRAWRRSLERIARSGRLRSVAACLMSRECGEQTECALSVATAAYAVLGLRDGLLRDDDRPAAMRVEAIAVELAARRLSSEEAARRRREGLSCEDLPDAGHMTEVLEEVLEQLPAEQRIAAMLDIAREGATGLARHLGPQAEAHE